MTKARATATAAKADAIVSCENIAVAYGGFQALQPTSLAFAPGQIHALVGQNGAGKTSFARALAGIVTPQSGRFFINGREARAPTVRQVRQLGLDIVHQRFTLPPSFTVAEALELVSAKKHGGAFFSFNALARGWLQELKAAGLEVSPRARIRDLPIETAQSLEIARALAGHAQFLILDEPTALLSPSGVERLFARLRQLRAQGVTLLVILHKLREVMEIADTVAVLRGGRLVLPPTPSAQLSQRQLSGLIIGEMPAAAPGASPREDASIPAERRGVKLAARQASTRQSALEPALAGISLAIEAGEILGIAGVEGNGQRSLVDILTGLMPVTGGSVHLLGQDVSALTHHQRRALGLRVVPFDRLTQGASLSLPLWENVTVCDAPRFRQRRRLWLNIGAMRRAARAALQQFDVQYDSLEQAAGALSGGNLQRLILARELAAAPQALIAAQPTRGLDFRATQFVWQVLRALKEGGGGILLVSSDLDELFHLSDRIQVLRGGQLLGAFPPPFDRRAIGDAMIGAQR